MKRFKHLIEETERYDPDHPDPEHHQREFHRRVAEHWPNGILAWHETPGHKAASIKKRGLLGDYGVFATIGKPSGFVSGHKTSTIFHIPNEYNHPDHIWPDMRYDPDNPHKDLLTQHPTLTGADIAVNTDKIHPSKIFSVSEE